jgi:formylmethanofuran dehydrogenase subunit E-like metal-binding protein
MSDIKKETLLNLNKIFKNEDKLSEGPFSYNDKNDFRYLFDGQKKKFFKKKSQIRSNFPIFIK